jgi:predicted metal-dependent hydrolase
MENIRINNLNVEYRVERRNVRHARIELKTGRLVLIVPHRFVDEKMIIQKHKNWISRKISEISAIKQNAAGLKPALRTSAVFKRIVMKSVLRYEKKMGVKAKRVVFKSMRTKWGSCSSLGNININTTMSKLPVRLIDYIVCHELNHFNHRRHNKEFFSAIGKYFNDYKSIEKQLAEYWFAINN